MRITKRNNAKCITASLTPHIGTKTLDEPTNSIDDIRKAAFDCLKRIELKMKVRLIGVRITQFESYQGIGSESFLHHNLT
jgi:hypothetical protein